MSVKIIPNLRALSLISVCALAGCSSLWEGEEPRALYTLRSCPVPVAKSGNISSLTVELPLSDLSLDTQRIAVTPSPYQRDYLAGGEWSDRLPKALQDVFVDSFTQRWGGAVINRSGASLKTDQLLQTDIQDFSVYGLGVSGAYVQLKILFKLIDFPNRRVIAAQTFCVRVPVTAYSLYAIVAAFNQGTNVLLGQAITWMEGQGRGRILPLKDVCH